MPQSTTDPIPARGIFALFKGDSGAGKSGGALSFPSPYVHDLDRKMPAISQKHFPNKKVDWDVFNDVFEIKKSLEWLINFYPYISEQAAADDGFTGSNDCPYETFIIDSITAASYLAIKTIDDVKGQNIYTMLKNVSTKEKKPSRVSSERRARMGLTDAPTEDSAVVKTIELRGYDYYNGEDSFLKNYIDTAKFLWARPGNPKHVIVIAHVLEHENKNIQTKVVERTRRIVTAGKAIAAYIPAQFDEMYQFYTTASGLGSDEGSHHVMSTVTVGEDNAKTAYTLEDQIDFTNKSLYDLISDQVNIGRPRTL